MGFIERSACGVCSGESVSAGLLFRSWNVSEGNAAILFDFDRNILEAVFEVGTLVLFPCSRVLGSQSLGLLIMPCDLRHEHRFDTECWAHRHVPVKQLTR